MKKEPESVQDFLKAYQMTKIAGRAILIVAVSLVVFSIYALITMP